MLNAGIEVSLPAVVPLGGRPVLAVVRYLSLRDLEVESDDLRVLAARMTVRIDLPDGEGPLRVTGNIVGRRGRRLQLRVVSFAVGGRQRVLRYIEAHDTLEAMVAPSAPPVQRARLTPRASEYWSETPTGRIVVEQVCRTRSVHEREPVMLDKPVVRRKMRLAPGVGRVARPVDDDPMARALMDGEVPMFVGASEISSAELPSAD